MTRTNAFRVWLLAGLLGAIAATPAMASDGYESVSAIAGPTQSSERDRGFESVSAIAGPVESSDDRGYQSVSAITGPVDDAPAPTSPVAVSEPGFDWGDALIGALVAACLMLLALGGARLIGSSRRPTVESRA